MEDTYQFILTLHPVYSALLIAIVGLVIGSFTNVVIYRLPRMMFKQWQEECEAFTKESISQEKIEPLNLAFPASHCPQCKAKVRAWQNIPVLSYVFLWGKCAYCHTKISLRYPIIEMMAAVLGFVAIYHFGFNLQGAAAALFSWSLLPMVFIDLDHQLLPDTLVLPTLWLGLLISLIPVFISPAESILGAAIGYLSLWLLAKIFTLLTGKEGMGHGDFKLFALLGAWMGYESLPLTILLASFLGAVIGGLSLLIRKQGKNTPIPFGPFLAFAGWIVFFWGHTITSFYWSFFQL